MKLSHTFLFAITLCLTSGIVLAENEKTDNANNSVRMQVLRQKLQQDVQQMKLDQQKLNRDREQVRQDQLELMRHHQDMMRDRMNRAASIRENKAAAQKQ